MEENLKGYELSRDWFDWCYENPERISPTHTAMYFFIIEHWNRMGQKQKFGLPMEMTKDGLGIKNYRTYTKVFNDLVDWGFVKVHQKSKNQYSANIVALVKNAKARTKAYTNACLLQQQKQVHGIVGVDNTNNLITKDTNILSSPEGEVHVEVEKPEVKEETPEVKIEDPKPEIPEEKFYLTKRKRKLSGKRLDSFLTFWEKFKYTQGKADAADAWLDIPQLTKTLCEKIYAAADIEAKKRPEVLASGKTPKMAQGWLNSRRYEDEIYFEKKAEKKPATIKNNYL
jgi:hypothetical protein